MSTLMRQKLGKLNRLQHLLPDGLLADAQWLTAQGYSRQLRGRYVEGGWLERLGRGLFRRPSTSPVHWQQVVASLQTLLGRNVAVGGRTALELQGYAHYPSPRGPRAVHLHGDDGPLPSWLRTLDGPRFVHRNTRRLFPSRPTAQAMEEYRAAAPDRPGLAPSDDLAWRRLDFAYGVVMSTPERAVLELLDELPSRESFHEADVLMSALVNLRPGRMSRLLSDCRSIKVKRLFLWFADRHEHQWFDRLDLGSVDLGRGKRMLVRGGKLDSKYRITMPEDIDAA